MLVPGSLRSAIDSCGTQSMGVCLAVRQSAMMVRGDGIAALGALCKVASPAPAVSIVDREVGFDIAWSRYGVDVWTHLPGKQNSWADALSRLHESGARMQVPVALRAIEETSTAERTVSWWEAREPPV